MKFFWKDLFRTIGQSKGRFLAIAGICALGVGFFGGLQMTCGSMKSALTDFYNDTNMMDIRIVCSLGISDENVEIIKNVEGVEGVMPSYESDILTNFGNDQCAVRVHALPNNLDTNDPNYINQQILESGSWPQNADECVLSADAVLTSPPKIGDEFEFIECSTGIDDTFSVRKLKVVGFIHSSYYVGHVSMGQSTLGKGTVNQIAYVPETTFKDNFPYSEVFIKVKGSENYITGTDAYQEKINEVMQRLEDLAPDQAEIRTSSLKSDAQKEIDENDKLLKEKYAEFLAKKESILDPINNAIANLENKLAQLPSVQQNIILNNSFLSITSSAIETNYNAAIQAKNGMNLGIDSSITLTDDLKALAEDEAAKSALDTIRYQTVGFKDYLEEDFYKDLTEENYNNQRKAQYTYYWSNLIGPVLSSRETICSALISGYQDALTNQLYPARANALAQFDENEKKLLEAQLQLADAQENVNSLEAKFYIMDRTKNYGAINFNNDAERIASIANVFPLMFFFVALLVVLTSMTRMIEEERTTIGTFKALGFSKYFISNKYILYGVISSLIGSAVGLAVLCQFLPFVIMYAYSIIYMLPIPLPMPFNWNIGIVSAFVGIALTIIATLMASVKSLRVVPARLMISVAPKAGKRILLERIKPIWKLLTFNWKITFRNMFLYKKRLFMTLIGVAGCTALLLTGFGLHDSISDIMNKQFDEIAFDNFKVIFESDATTEQEEDVRNKIQNYDPNSTSTLIHEENAVAMPEGKPNAPITIAVPKNIDQFQEMRVLQSRLKKDKFVLDDEGVYISEKLASMMNVSEGDYITVYNQDLIGNAGDEEYSFKIAGVVENYIAHYIYMTPTVYKQYFHKDCIFKNLIARTDAFNQNQQEVLDVLHATPFVKTAFFTTSTRETFDTMLRSVNLVVVVLIVSAGLLAFVVLYNLININICERSREIATLKVLGANKHEVNMYIHRETILLSVMGALIGIALGIFLEQFVIISAEVDLVMFGRTIYWWSYALSVGITLIFSVLVSLFMRRKLFSISMVESLKSVE